MKKHNQPILIYDGRCLPIEKRGYPIPMIQLATERVVISQPRSQEAKKNFSFKLQLKKKSSTKPDQY
jgi:hypothetical protein